MAWVQELGVPRVVLHFGKSDLFGMMFHVHLISAG